MKKILSLLLLLALPHGFVGHTPWDNGKLKVSDTGRYLQFANGKPFFLQDDTCWLLVQKLTRDEIKASCTVPRRLDKTPARPRSPLTSV